MADIFSAKKRSAIMSKIKGKNTKPELLVRKALFRRGYRYSLHKRNLPGQPDIVLAKYKCAIQVRGCFWHQHNCRDGHIPKSRKRYWQEKLQKNKERDKRNDRKLRNMGWSVITVWECHCKTEKCLFREIARIEKIVQSKRTGQ